MARPLRIQFPGALYHVNNRGNERKPIFKDDTDRRKFLGILSESSSIYSTRLYKIIGQCLLVGDKFVNKIKSTYLKDKDYDRERPAVGEVRKYLSRDTVLDEICSTLAVSHGRIEQP